MCCGSLKNQNFGSKLDTAVQEKIRAENQEVYEFIKRQQIGQRDYIELCNVKFTYGNWWQISDSITEVNKWTMRVSIVENGKEASNKYI